MTTPKNNVVRLRLTEVEREQWSEAAGGKGKLSEWIRYVCNVASSPDRVVPREEPVSVRPDASVAAEAVEERQGRQSGSPARQALPSAPRTERRDDEPSARQGTKEDAVKCSRWMHHRKGVYCGTCKTVN